MLLSPAIFTTAVADAPPRKGMVWTTHKLRFDHIAEAERVDAQMRWSQRRLDHAPLCPGYSSMEMPPRGTPCLAAAPDWCDANCVTHLGGCITPCYPNDFRGCVSESQYDARNTASGRAALTCAVEMCSYHFMDACKCFCDDQQPPNCGHCGCFVGGYACCMQNRGHIDGAPPRCTPGGPHLVRTSPPLCGAPQRTGAFGAIQMATTTVRECPLATVPARSTKKP